MLSSDTIAAIATPPGEGAIAIIRISGPETPSIVSRVFKPARKPPSARLATLGTIHDDGEPVDEVLLTMFSAPASFTGEDVAEIACHGGMLLAAQLLKLVLRNGARAAEPGEFSQRAFVNGKMDLTRAEAVMDIIRARTPLALRAAARQLEGRLGNAILTLRDTTLTTVANLEAWIDFPDEDIDPASGRALIERIQSTLADIEELLATADEGRVLREGVRVAIAGIPNAGKSSLLNRLLGMERAIVSEIPGTTRDTIEETACLHGILFRLTDTAGLRDTNDPVEKEGVARTSRALEQADLVLHVIDASLPGNPAPLAERELLVANKCDLLGPSSPVPHGAIRVSSRTGEGFERLVAAMLDISGASQLAATPTLAAINSRHQALLENAASALRHAIGLLDSKEPAELAAVELRTGLDALGQIVGATDTEDILGEIFSRFCIGK
jgi:tRNA modification GTPase